MDHQQNYEYGDPSAFGFISSFSSSDNFLLGQPHQGQQQLNGKSQTDLSHLAPIQNYDAGESVSSSEYLTQAQPMLYHLPDTLVSPTQPTALYPQTSLEYQHMTTISSDISLSTQKDSMFNLANPPAAVPVDIIQPSETSHTQVNIPQAQETLQSSLQQIATLTTTTPEMTKNSADIGHPLEQSVEETSEKETSTVSPEQKSTTKALGVVRKEVLVSASGAKKRRRRILQINEDDSDDDTELKKQLLDDSLEKEIEKDKETEDSSPDSDSDDPALANDPGALKVRSLLKGAVIIRGPDSLKKKKKRVLESDDEDVMQTSVDDIGLIETNENENEEELLTNDIIVGEANFESSEPTDKVASIDTPAVPLEELSALVMPALGISEEAVGKTEEIKELITKSDEAVTVKQEQKNVTVEEDKSIVKIEDTEIDPSMSVEAILENIKPMADDDEFFKVDEKSDDSDCQFVSNEDYFGTPDSSKPQPPGNRRRGPPTGGRRSQSQSSNKRRRSNKYEKDFVEGSSESEDTSYSESSASSSESSGPDVRRPTVKKAPFIVQTKSFSVARVPIRKKSGKKDRFYDKSRDIPNDVYFGDVKVPLHVLHTRWDSDAESSGSSGGNRNSHSKPTNFSRFTNISSSNNSRTSFNYIDQTDDPKLSTLKEFAKISGIKINFVRLFNGIRSTDDKCMLIRRILAQKGLQGEPTIAKCKQLRLDLQAKRESAELDKSLIIRSEGRTRRATRNVSSKSPFSLQPSTSSAIIQPETLQTLSKIRRVVDSDSE